MHSPVNLIKAYDAASPYLYKACCEGQTLQEVEIKWYAIDDTGSEKEYFIHKLENVKVASMSRNLAALRLVACRCKFATSNQQQV